MDREVLSIILLLILVFLIILILVLNNSKKIDSTIRNRVWQDVLQIKSVINTKNPMVYRDVIIRLDSLLSKSLQLYYRNSESCGNNLKQARDLFNKDDYNKIWQVHKLRNEIVHENKDVEFSQLTDGYNIMSKAIRKILYG